MDNRQQKLYLTFDDGPHPILTQWILDELDKYKAKATFFLLGKQIEQNPFLVSTIVRSGHSVGNHSFLHGNGWNTKNEDYYLDIKKTETSLTRIISDKPLSNYFFDQKLFRPPYGKIKWKQLNDLRQEYVIVMWDVLSGDFDPLLSAEKCYQNCVKNIENGSIIVFHENENAAEKLQYCLPRLLKIYSEKGYTFEAL